MLHVREVVYRPPADVFSSLQNEPDLVWLDSAAVADPRSRYSYLCVRPFQFVEVLDGKITVDGDMRGGDPFTVLETELARWRIEPDEAPVPFAGGAVGFLGYALGAVLEHVPSRHPNPLRLPDLSFGFYDVVIAFDGWAERCWLLSSGFPELDPVRRQHRAERRAAEILASMAQFQAPISERIAPVSWTHDIDRDGYEKKIRQVLEYIRAGDLFQANFTTRALAPRPPGVSAASLYARLRRESPAPFAAFLAFKGIALASASPERFIRLDRNGRIESRPIKGTRPRDADPVIDRRLHAELAASAKDHAENLMIVDLMRNDLGRVAAIGSVSVPSLCVVESFASVHHLVSEIRAQLRAGLGPIDVLRAAFPGGSITGAPKIRAMTVIDDLETARRGPYCGSIAWIGFDGSMDSSIIIRTLLITPTTLIAQAGGGIVSDSEPAAEYDEMRVKLAPLLRAGGHSP